MHDEHDAAPTRRRMLKTVMGAGALLAATPSRLLANTVGGMADLGFTELPDGTLAEQSLYALPGKLPLIKKTFRPPNFETPVEYFRTVITPNDAFFVRWHLSDIPNVDGKTWKLSIGGDSVEKPATYTMAQLKAFPSASVTALCLCSGNRRGLSDPHVAGVEWGAGAMGNAVWRGVRLKDVLARSGVKRSAIEVSMNGADHAPTDKTPIFVKSIPIAVAMDENTLIAFEMNGKPLPHWNGYPARLVVPGWTGTYWVKQIAAIRAVSAPEGNFWMKTAYRLPRDKFPTPHFTSQVTEANEPITAIVTNSLITSLSFGEQLPRGKPVPIRGIAWDGGSGIVRVDVSTDGGTTWQPARLGADHGRYSFREFSLDVPTKGPGTMVVMTRATSKSGETQAEHLIFNPAGYHNNVSQRLFLQIV